MDVITLAHKYIQIMNADVKYCQIADVLLALANLTLSSNTCPVSATLNRDEKKVRWPSR